MTIAEVTIGIDDGNHNGTNKSNHFDVSVPVSNHTVDGDGVIETERAVSGPLLVKIPMENGDIQQIQPETAAEVISDKVLSDVHIEERDHAINHLDRTGIIQSGKVVSAPSSVETPLPTGYGDLKLIQHEAETLVGVVSDKALNSVHTTEKNHVIDHFDGNDVTESEKTVPGPSSVEIPAENGDLKQTRPETETAVEMISDKALSFVHIEERIRAINQLDGNVVIQSGKVVSAPSSVEIPTGYGDLKQIQHETETLVEVASDEALTSVHMTEKNHAIDHFDGNDVTESEKTVPGPTSVEIPAGNRDLNQTQPETETTVEMISDKDLSSVHVEEGNHANNQLDGTGKIEVEKAVSGSYLVEIPAENGNFKQIQFQSETIVTMISEKALSDVHIEVGNHAYNDLDTNGVIQSEKVISGPSSVKIHLPTGYSDLKHIQHETETLVEVVSDKALTSVHIAEKNHAIDHFDGNDVTESEKTVPRPSSVEIPAENGDLKRTPHETETAVEMISDKDLRSVHIEEGNLVNNQLDGTGKIEREKAVSGPSLVEIPAENGNLKEIQSETILTVISEKASSYVHTEKGNHTYNHLHTNDIIQSEKVVSGPSSVEIPAGNGGLKQIQHETETLVEVEVEVVSDKALTSVRTDGVVPISTDEKVIDCAQRHPFSALDSKFKINLFSTSKPQLRELKRKCENDVGRVRKVAKTMEGRWDRMAPEFIHSAVSNGLVVSGMRGNGYGTQAYSGTRLVGHVPYKPNIRPFNQLRVSLVENGLGMVDSTERQKRTPKTNQLYRNSEFLLAKDKFPPSESNKKSKSNGKKSDFGFAEGSKVYKSCSALLEKLMKHKHGWVFNVPVDVKGLGLHDYFLIIKNPMDLGTVKTRLSTFWYKSPVEFAEDVRLTFHNAMLYNPKGQDVHIMAETLLKIFENKWPDIESKYLRELRMAVDHDAGLPTPRSWRSNPSQLPAFPPAETRVFNRSESIPHSANPKPRTLTHAPSFRKPALTKPKAKDVDKREMTYDEKQKLSTNLQSLPPEKLDGVLQIIKRSSALSQNDDEIEVDIDILDTETLWELDRFVTNYKKSLSKNRRKAELANQMRASATQTMEKTTKAHQTVALTENTAGNGNATLPSPAPGNGPSANAGESSTSSSSSSSGSSSGDSDSDSSSGSDAGKSQGA